MEKILTVACKKAMYDVCIGCSRYAVAFDRREGAFSRYKGQWTEIIGLLNCGDRPRVTTETLPAQVKPWKPSVNERPTIIHLGLCLMDHCAYRDETVVKIQANSGIDVIIGTYPYNPEIILA